MKVRIEVPKELNDEQRQLLERFAAASGDTKFAAAVASFGMLLRNSEYKGNATWDAVLEIATEGVGEDSKGHRGEFLGLVRRAKELSGE